MLARKTEGSLTLWVPDVKKLATSRKKGPSHEGRSVNDFGIAQKNRLVGKRKKILSTTCMEKNSRSTFRVA